MNIAPSVSNSITVRLELPARATAVSELTTAIETSGGLVTGLDVTASRPRRLQVDVTIATRGTEHDDEVVAAMRAVDGVEIGKVSDRTLLLDAQTNVVTDDVLVAAANALANIIGEDQLNPTYIIPSVFHPDVAKVGAAAVRAAALSSQTASAL
jgi:hypothetical protein